MRHWHCRCDGVHTVPPRSEKSRAVKSLAWGENGPRSPFEQLLSQWTCHSLNAGSDKFYRNKMATGAQGQGQQFAVPVADYLTKTRALYSRPREPTNTWLLLPPGRDDPNRRIPAYERAGLRLPRPSSREIRHRNHNGSLLGECSSQSYSVSPRRALGTENGPRTE